MKVTRLDTGSDGESLFDDTGIPLEDTGDIDSPSRWIPTNGVALRETGSDYDFAWHDAPHRHFVVMRSGGAVEIEAGHREKRRFSPGDILPAEAPTGRGHQSRADHGQARMSLFIALDA